jgi:hypothetical protein
MRTVTFPINEAIRERVNAVARRLGQGLGLTAADALDLGLAALEREIMRHDEKARLEGNDAWRGANRELQPDLPTCLNCHGLVPPGVT